MFEDAVKEACKLRLALCGPTGAGKTYSALTIAMAIAGQPTETNKIAVIDTEHGSASKYADLFKFKRVNLVNHHPQNYIDAIRAASAAGFEVLIIDSLSHAWMGVDGALELKEKAAKKTHNDWTAWRDVTPLHNKLVDAILGSKCHVIVTMRSKMEHVMKQDKNGKTTVERVGMEAIQRDGISYEFDLILDMTVDHDAIVGKTRIPAVDGQVVHKPGAEFAATLMQWLNSGVSVPHNPDSEGGSVQEAKQDAPATASATAPDEDEKALNEHDWKAIFEAGKATGWTPVNIYSYAAAKYNVKPTQIASGITKWQGREIYKFVKENKPA